MFVLFSHFFSEREEKQFELEQQEPFHAKATESYSKRLTPTSR